MPVGNQICEESMVECPVCLRDFEVGPEARQGDIIQCPHCKIWLELLLENGQWVAERVPK